MTIKLDNISRRVKNLSREICEISKLLFVTCGGSNAPLLRLACQSLKTEKKKRESRRGSSKQPMTNTGITIEDAPATFKWFVWQHFGHPAEMINGCRVTDKLSVTYLVRLCLHYLHSVLTE